jgi:hypothetical protein
MTRLALILTSIAAGSVLLATAAGALSASAGGLGTASSALEVGGGTGHLFVPGDRVVLRYTVYSGSKAVRGTLYVRNDLQRTFTRLPLTRAKAYQTRVPARLLRGHRLFYYAVFRDPRSRRLVTLPAAGARAPRTAWILGHPLVVQLGTHRFGDTRPPEAVVARASASAVGWRDPGPGQGPKAGPQTILIHRDGSVWLDDEINNRLLVWRAGHPEAIAGTVPLPLGSDASDLTFGPGGSLYVTRVAGVGRKAHVVLDRLTASGARIWESRLGGSYSPDAKTFALGVNSPLRLGPDGTLYCLTFMGMFGADEWGWMPAASRSGKTIAPAAQRRGTHWPFAPVAGGLRLLGPEVYTPHDDMAAHELRYALVDRRGRVVRAWRVLSRTELGVHQTVTDVVGGDPIALLDFYKEEGGRLTREYEVLRLGAHGLRERFSVARALWGDTTLPDLRVGPDGNLYQLATSPETGVVVSRFSLG